jgi:hypothetical protein
VLHPAPRAGPPRPTQRADQPKNARRSLTTSSGTSIAAWWLDFTVESPPALVDHLQVLADRYAATVAGSR